MRATGLVTFVRDEGGGVRSFVSELRIGASCPGFVFEEPENFPGRKIDFRKRDAGIP